MGHYYIYRKVLSRKLYDRRDNLQRHHKLRSLTCLIWTARVASLCGMCAAPFLAVLAVYDTARYTHTHLYWGAYPFFVLSAFKMFFYSIVYYQFAKVEQYDRTKYAWSRAMQKSGSLKFTIFFVFTVAFVFYLPVGRQFQHARKLPLPECRYRLNLSSERCRALRKDPQPTNYRWTWKDAKLAKLSNDDPRKWQLGSLKFDPDRQWTEQDMPEIPSYPVSITRRSGGTSVRYPKLSVSCAFY